MDNSIVSFVGIDIAKRTLDLHCRPHNRALSTTNDPQGFEETLAFLPEPRTCLIVVEAIGGYQRSLVGALLHAGHHVAVVDSQQVRDFARGLGIRGVGILAETGAIDAAVLSRYAEGVRPRTMSITAENQAQIVELVTRRRQLIDLRTAERNRLETLRLKSVRKSVEQVLKVSQKQIKAVEKAIASLLESDDDRNGKARLPLRVPGIGPTSVASLLADLPELGR